MNCNTITHVNRLGKYPHRVKRLQSQRKDMVTILPLVAVVHASEIKLARNTRQHVRNLGANCGPRRSRSGSQQFVRFLIQLQFLAGEAVAGSFRRRNSPGRDGRWRASARNEPGTWQMGSILLNHSREDLWPSETIASNPGGLSSIPSPHNGDDTRGSTP